MNVLKSKYYASSKYLMEHLGLWPYQSSKRRFFGMFMYMFITSSYLLPEILYLATRNESFNQLVENMINVIFGLVSQLKYLVSFYSASQLKILLSQIKKDWRRITDEEEQTILKKLAEESRLISSFYISYCFIGLILYMGSPFVPLLLENLFPLKNGSYPLLVPFNAEYVFFEQLDYHYLCCIHGFIGVYFFLCLHATVDTIYLCTVTHISGLFTVVSHRFRNMFNSDDINVNLDNLKKGVQLYNDTIRCCQLLEDSFSICLLIVTLLSTAGVAALAMYATMVLDNAFMLVRTLAFLGGMIMQMSYCNWIGQKVIDSSEKVFYSTYFSQWYRMPIKIRKLVIIIMARTSKPHELTAGKIITLSLYTFGSLMKSCSSVFVFFTCLQHTVHF